MKIRKKSPRFQVPSVLVLAFVLLSAGTLAHARVYIDEFTSNIADSANTTGVWNYALGILHPTLKVTGYVPGAGTLNFDIGDGHHGAFGTSTYANFSQNGDVSGNTIRINTDTYTELDFTTFDLASTWTIRPTGSKPLIIKVLGVANVAGIIDCSGENGSAINMDYTVIPSGGKAHCGGGAGGNGGSSSGPATNGATGGTDGGGIAGGPTAGALGGDAGGGGAAYSQTAAGYSPTAGTKPSAGVGSAAGAPHIQDDAFTIIGGGAGGGGGGVYDQADVNRSSGGGGGAGGGIVLMYAGSNINIMATGGINTNGGNGGGGATGKAGGGGGGGGGSILLLSAGNADLSGPVTALQGTGGTSAGGGGTGGNGGKGRTWITDNDGVPTNNGDNPTSLLTVIGTVVYNTGLFTFTSQFVDFRNTKPTFSSAVLASTLAGAGTATLDFEGSTDGVTAASPWTTASSISSLNGYRFLRYRVQLNNAVASTGTHSDSLTVNYEMTSKDNFNFMAASCGAIKNIGGPGAGGGSKSSALPAVFLFLAVILVWKTQRRISST